MQFEFEVHIAISPANDLLAVVDGEIAQIVAFILKGTNHHPSFF